MPRNAKRRKAAWQAACLLSAMGFTTGSAFGGMATLLTSSSGSDPSPVVPADYSAAVAARQGFLEDFSGFPPGRPLDSIALTNFSLRTESALVALESAGEAGLGRALPSAPLAASVLTGGPIASIEWLFSEPVASMDMIFINLAGAGVFEVTYADGSMPSSLSMPSSGAPYQWAGLLADENIMSRVRFVPNSASNYGFDDVRSTRVPEPRSAAILVALIGMAGGFSGRRIRRPA